MKPPAYIDGARVLEWAWSDDPFGDLRYDDGLLAAAIHGLAVCQYDGSSDVYRFSCNAQWECEQDQVYESVQQAKSELPEQYCKTVAVWQSGA